MSFKAKLVLGDNPEDREKVFILRKFSYSLTQVTRENGRPTAVVKGGQIEVQVESTKNITFAEWMFSSHVKLNGSIIFESGVEEGKTMKELKFEEAFLTNYREDYEADGGEFMTESFTISPRIIKLGKAVHDNMWQM